ncbi:Plasmodium vivax Vir protein, putative [Plasmodium vivax]|nr:Plasmodium vivax Vir protein, putative [Plasmodium vivax]
MAGTPNADWGELDIVVFSREKGLISRKIYDELEKEFNLTDYDVYCGKADEPKHHTHVRYVCATILNYLKNHRVSDNKSDEFSTCKLLNYWAYSKLSERYGSTQKSEIKLAFEVLEKIWRELVHDSNRLDYYEKCKPDIMLFSYTDWEKIKELYDYYVDIFPISQYPEFYSKDCDQYYKYIKYKKKIYDQYEEFCSNRHDFKNCPTFFEKYRKYDPKVILPKLTCYQQMIKEEATQDHASSSPQEYAALRAHPPPLNNGEIADSSTPIGNKAGNALLGVVATSMTSGALYKFTPLGRILRNRFGWNNNMRNLNGAENGLYDYAPESFNPYSGGGEEHYIGYHPA